MGATQGVKEKKFAASLEEKIKEMLSKMKGNSILAYL